jgi:DNA topoisomerase-1
MARLRYVSTTAPGYSRRRNGRGFTYLDSDGTTIRDPALRRWIEDIVIPPAWTDVWISPYRNGHILATGRDDKGRKQYRYHPDWQQARSQKKFDQLYAFGECLPRIRETTESHLRQRSLSRERVLAAIVRLLETTLIRIGNAEYAQANDSYGLTTLTDDHARINGSEIVFDFVGKSGKEHTVMLRDRRLARIVKRCQDLDGYHLFQYYDENNQQQAVGSADVNAYLHEISGQPFTAKHFRTWGGSVRAVEYLCAHCADGGETAAAARDCIAHVAESLGNTKTVCRQYYIHPAILDAWADGSLPALYAACQADTEPGSALSAAERTLMRLIEQINGKANKP